MIEYRDALPQLGANLFVTDGGIETTLVHHYGVHLPGFAAFHVLRDGSGVGLLHRYFESYVRIAHAYGCGLVLESPTWRANADWGARLGYDAAGLAQANRKAISLLGYLRRTYQTNRTRMVISGNIGPRGDGYVPARRMSSDQAYDYHSAQIETFAGTDADMVAAFTMNYADEALGIVRAACASDMPVAISFTLETDGRLPSGQTLADAIRRIDDETAAYPAYYMINCAHPTHFARVIDGSADWAQRIRGLRANASTRSHAELDACVDLDAGDPRMLAMEYKALREALPKLTIVGGCCGTDERHVAQICSRLMGPPGANHSALAPNDFTTRAHLSRSVLRNDANSDALPPPKSIPMLS